MRRRKLLIGLVSAGAFSAGFGAAVFPAAAELRTITVTLLGGQTVTVQVDGSGSTSAQTPAPAVTTTTSAPAATTTASTPATEPSTTTPTSTSTSTSPAPPPAPPVTTDAPPPPPAPETPTTTPTTPTAPAETAPDTTDSADAVPTVAAGGQQKQKTIGKTVRKDAEESAAAIAERVDAKPEPIRRPDGAPTPANPTFSEALPGPAPIGVPNFFIDKFRIPPFLLPIYQAAGIEYGVRWEILAGINEIETDYGRNLNVSTAGALGWMQFMPSTWKRYGVDANHDGKKDPYNPVDAIFAAARYLKAAGADTDVRRAIFAYNHADWYVDSVLMRARLIGGMPADLIGSLTGLTQGRFPVDARATYADDLSENAYKRKIARGHNAAVPVDGSPTRRGIDIYTKAGARAIATQDGKIVRIGRTKRLGRFIQLQDVYGNTYTYANLKKIATAYAVPKERSVSSAAVRQELHLPKKDPAPTEPASAGRQAPANVQRSSGHASAAEPAVAGDPVAEAASVEKERAFANPARPQPYTHGGEQQIVNGSVAGVTDEYKATFAKVIGLDSKDVDIKRLRVGAKVVAGTVLGAIGVTQKDRATHLHFEIRPAGRGAPRIDPKPILDGWKLLESTAIYRAAGKNPFFGPDAKQPSIGQILLMSKESLQRRVLADPRVEVYECGRRDIRAGNVDRRVLATLEFLSASGLKPTVTSIQCGHGFYTASGNVSEHSSGDAVDIAAINGIPILGHQGAGSITDVTIRRLLTLQGTMKPHQIISLMTFPGADNTLALPDHNDHIHVGFRPMFGSGTKAGRRVEAVLKPKQWIKLIDRLGKIDNPKVLETPSKYAIDDQRPDRASVAHKGE